MAIYIVISLNHIAIATVLYFASSCLAQWISTDGSDMDPFGSRAVLAHDAAAQAGLNPSTVWEKLRHTISARFRQNEWEPASPVGEAEPAHITTARDIINYDAFGAGGHRQKPLRLQIKAVPNKRLVDAFALDNSFTTTDVKRSKEFVAQAKACIDKYKSPEAWDGLHKHAGQAIALQIKAAENLHTLSLAPLIRSVCLSTALSFLHGKDVNEMSLQGLQDLTDAINDLWMATKHKSPKTFRDAVREVRVKAKMWDAVESLFGRQARDDDDENPLNLIMPAYESLWRVVLLTFVSSFFCDPHCDSDVEILAAAATLGDTQHHADHKVRDKALLLAKEGQRLFPSIKSIYRAAPPSETPPAEHLRADIVACHTDPAVWGPDANVFAPCRWLPGGSVELNGADKLAYMPFGLAPTMCPASHGFGFDMVTVLVCALRQAFDPDRVELVSAGGDDDDGNGNGSDDGGLATGRGDMERWRLVWREKKVDDAKDDDDNDEAIGAPGELNGESQGLGAGEDGDKAAE